MEIKIPAFHENDFSDHYVNLNARVVTIRGMLQASFQKYCDLFSEHGLVRKEARCSDMQCFAAYQYDSEGIFLNYYKGTGELVIVIETNCKYFDYYDVNLDKYMQPQISSLHLEDFGLSYVIRLSDGRYIIFDGGRAFEPDAESLMNCLKEGAGGKKPVIAVWIMTHPHGDHFHCFFPFMELYKDEVIIEKFFINFPEKDNIEKYPELLKEKDNLPRFEAEVRALGVPVYMPHTGQIYRVGDAVLEIMSCIDDTFHRSDKINTTSLIVRMELAGQVILWTADARFEVACLAERYGAYLKADILQVPHHGFGSGSPEAAIAGYKFIMPKVCLLPTSDYNAYTTFGPNRKCTEYIMRHCGVKELITGGKTRTLTLPYEPDENAAQMLRANYLSGKESAGARTWIFTELNTSKESDFEFRILNTTNIPAEVSIDIFFEDGTGKGKVRFIKTTVLATRIRKICIIDPEDVESETVYYNPCSLGKSEIPKDTCFAVRFMSSLPVVVSHKEHVASYRTSVYY